MKSKRTGSEIESFEIERKRKIIESIIARIKLNLKNIREMVSEFRTNLKKFDIEKGLSKKDVEEITRLVRNIIPVSKDCLTAYLSIKKDLENTFKDNNRISELFPTIKISLSEENINSFRPDFNNFFSILRQELDLLEYLNRFR